MATEKCIEGKAFWTAIIVKVLVQTPFYLIPVLDTSTAALLSDRDSISLPSAIKYAK